MFRMKALSLALVNSTKFVIDQNAKRTLYAPAALGMEGFLHARERIKMQITNVDTFKSKMDDFVKDENSKNLIFTEDLKNMVHICDNQTDIELMVKMVERFCKQSSEVRFGNYVFGPPIFRLLHHSKDPETALKLFKDTSLDGFFDQLISYQLLTDLLYKSERYQDVLDVFDVIKSRQVQGGRFPKHVIVLTFAACYKLNTPASFEYAKDLLKNLSEAGHIPMRRGLTFVSMLALNQNSPQIALEILSNLRQQTYLTVRTIKALAYIKLKRYDDALTVLKSVLEIDNPMINKQTFPVDSIEAIKEAVKGVNSKEIQADLTKTLGFLEKHGHVSTQTLDEILCSEITVQVNSDRGGGFNDRGGFNERGGFNDRSNDRGGYRDRYQQDSPRDSSNQRDFNSDYPRRHNERNRQFRNNRDFDTSERVRRPGLHELN